MWRSPYKALYQQPCNIYDNTEGTFQVESRKANKYTKSRVHTVMCAMLAKHDNICKFTFRLRILTFWVLYPVFFTSTKISNGTW